MSTLTASWSSISTFFCTMDSIAISQSANSVFGEKGGVTWWETSGRRL